MMNGRFDRDSTGYRVTMFHTNHSDENSETAIAHSLLNEQNLFSNCIYKIIEKTRISSFILEE